LPTGDDIYIYIYMCVCVCVCMCVSDAGVTPLVLEGGSLHMLSKSQTWTLDADQTVHLECEFVADRFNLFDNPIVWRKRQQRPAKTWSSSSSSWSSSSWSESSSDASPDETPMRRHAQLPFHRHSYDDIASASADEWLPEVDVVTTMTSSALTSSDDDDDEETQINMMGNLVEPFASAKRFRATFQSQQSKSQSFLFGLTISSESSINYFLRCDCSID